MPFLDVERSSHPPFFEIAPVQAKRFTTGFSNPFRQYDGGAIPDWHYGGDATLFNDYMSLTPAAPNRIGWAWSNRPLEMPAWEVRHRNGTRAPHARARAIAFRSSVCDVVPQVEFEFHVGGAEQRGSGGGLALWWVAEPAVPGTIYGHADTFNGLGIFLDTYEPQGIEVGNAGAEPYIVAMVNDGKPLGGTLNDAEKLASKQVAVCFAKYRNLAHIGRARVAWANGMLRLWLDLDRSHVYQPCLETAIGDSRMANMPTTGYFGVSASTGPYGDAHVLYSMSIARLDPLLDNVELATPHVATPGEEPPDPSHLVHAEAADHETHMKIVPSEVPVEKHAEAGAEPQHPTPVHVPPTVDESEVVTHALAAMESSREIRDALISMQEELSQLSLAHAHKASELLDQVKTLQAEVLATKTAVASAPAAGTGSSYSGLVSEALAAEGASEHSLTQVMAKVDVAGRHVEEHGKLLSSVSGKLDAASAAARHAEVEASSAAKTLLGKLEAVDTVLESRMSTLSAHITKVKEEMDAVRRETHGTTLEVKSESAALKAAVEQLKRSASSSQPSTLFPLAVCAQALVVAAVLFYATAGGGKKSRSHLP